MILNNGETYLMPRRERKQSGTGIYHVMLRGINQQGCLDMDERKVISDESVRMEILKHCGASNITEFMLHSKERQKDIIRDVMRKPVPMILTKSGGQHTPVHIYLLGLVGLLPRFLVHLLPS